MHQQLDEKSQINGNVDAGISGKNMAISIMASKLLFSGHFDEAEAIKVATDMYNKGAATNNVKAEPVAFPLIVLGAECLANPICAGAAITGLGIIWKVSVDYVTGNKYKDDAIKDARNDIEYFNYKKDHESGVSKVTDSSNKTPSNTPEPENNNDHTLRNKIILESIKKALDHHQHTQTTLDPQSEWKIDQVIQETENTNVQSFTSNYEVDENEAIELGLKWLGKNYKQIGPLDRGVFRSADGLRQFRIDNNSLLGNHNPYKPHIHIEKVAPNGKDLLSQNHIILRK